MDTEHVTEGGGRMTIAEKIFHFLKKNKKKSYCDDCIAEN
jgi:hypothetical protein